MSYDLVIVGGGIAGIAAAVQAARQGCRVALVEKTALTGGLATAGLINVFLPLCDGNGHQVSFGLAEEMLRRSLKYGPGEIPPHWRDERDAAERKRFISVFSPASLVLALDELLKEAGVTVYLDTLLCAAKTAGNRLTGVAVENESGRFTLRARQFIDASGSAVLGRRLGLPVTAGENYFSLWALEYVQGKIEMNIGAVYGNGAATGKFSDAALAESGWSRQRLAEQKQTGIDGRLVSEYLLKTRGYLRGYYRHCYRQEEATRESLYPVALPIMPQYRKICAIQAAETMRDGQANRHVPDSVGWLPTGGERLGLGGSVPVAVFGIRTGKPAFCRPLHGSSRRRLGGDARDSRGGGDRGRPPAWRRRWRCATGFRSGNCPSNDWATS